MFEVIQLRGPRSIKFVPEKHKEIEGLVKLGTFKVVLRIKMPEDPNIMGGRCVLTIKDKDIVKKSGRHVLSSKVTEIKLKLH